jgi:ubiquitin-protein ligase
MYISYSQKNFNMASIRKKKGQHDRTGIIMRHRRDAIQQANPCAQWYFPDDINKFYCLLRFPESKDDVNYCSDFPGGEYVVTGVLPPAYPSRPPKKVMFLTPNGVYKVGGSICIDGGEYHPENYRKEQGFPMFIIGQIMSCMLNFRNIGTGISHIHRNTSTAEKIRLARASRAYNREKLRNYKNEDLFQEFENDFPNWQLRVAKIQSEAKAILEKEKAEREKAKADEAEANEALDDLDF